MHYYIVRGDNCLKFGGSLVVGQPSKQAALDKYMIDIKDDIEYCFERINEEIDALEYSKKSLELAERLQQEINNGH